MDKEPRLDKLSSPFWVFGFDFFGGSYGLSKLDVVPYKFFLVWYIDGLIGSFCNSGDAHKIHHI